MSHYLFTFANRFKRTISLILFVAFILPFLIPLSNEATPPAQLILDGGRFITVDGVQTYVVERGPVDGTPILFIHGLFGSTFSARYQIEPLAAAGYRVIAYDRPGFGLSEKPYRFDYSTANQADFAAHLLDALAIPQAVIWAHSGGGAIQMHFALTHAERLSRMVTVDGAILGGGGLMGVAGNALRVAPLYRWAQIGVRTFFQREQLTDFLRNFYADPAQVTNDAVAGYWRLCETADWERGVLGQLRDAGQARFSQALLSQITVETLLVWGEDDLVTPLADGQRLQEWLGNATMAVIPRVGHLPMEEAPDEFNQIILTFLQDDE